jgi:hypothetical protein
MNFEEINNREPTSSSSDNKSKIETLLTDSKLNSFLDNEIYHLLKAQIETYTLSKYTNSSY